MVDIWIAVRAVEVPMDLEEESKTANRGIVAALEDLLTLEQAAARCGCSAGTVRRRAARGQIIHLIRLGRRCVRLRRSDVEALAAAMLHGQASAQDDASSATGGAQ